MKSNGNKEYPHNCAVSRLHHQIIEHYTGISFENSSFLHDATDSIVKILDERNELTIYLPNHYRENFGKDQYNTFVFDYNSGERVYSTTNLNKMIEYIIRFFKQYNESDENKARIENLKKERDRDL